MVSIHIEDPKKVAIAHANQLDVSPRKSIDVCNNIKGMQLDRAEQWLKDVIVKKRSMPFRKHGKSAGHRSDLVGYDRGGYPVLAAKATLKMLESAKANASFKGLDTKKLFISHARANKLLIGRSRGNRWLTNMEVVLQVR